MASTLSLPFSLHSKQKHKQQQSLFLNTHFIKHPVTLSFTPTLPSKPSHPSLLLHKFDRFSLTPSFSSSSSETSSISSPDSYLNEPLTTARFLGTEEQEKLKILENFRYFHQSESWSLCIRVMRQEEMQSTVGLLSESFADSMSMAFSYVPLLEFLIKQYLIERRYLMPNMATLVGFYRREDGEEELAGTVEVSFNSKGANDKPPTPSPPKDSPYICNMTVKKSLRRKGIGWNLLKASEELIPMMNSTSNDVYLHCRLIDSAPLNMYTKAGYKIIKTDNILILLTLQRRKHLMHKKLPVINNTSELDISTFEDNLVS